MCSRFSVLICNLTVSSRFLASELDNSWVTPTLLSMSHVNDIGAFSSLQAFLYEVNLEGGDVRVHRHSCTVWSRDEPVAYS